MEQLLGLDACRERASQPAVLVVHVSITHNKRRSSTGHRSTISMVRPRVFFDFVVGNESFGRIILELFNDTTPKTTENFRALCTGEKGLSPSGNLLHYKGSIIHRSIKNFMLQGGDFTKRNGTGGESIYGGNFEDEDLSRFLNMGGLLCMANKGPDTNSSQFFITLDECPHLNGHHVVFGRILKGYKEVIERLANIPVDEKDRPTVPIVIANCGELELRKVPTAGAMNRADSRIVSEPEKSLKVRKRSTSLEPDSERKPKHKKHRSGSRGKSSRREILLEDLQETEEEYDARLEREERERLAINRKKELAMIKEQHANSSNNSSGIRFKGRGRMKFIDPESDGRFQ